MIDPFMEASAPFMRDFTSTGLLMPRVVDDDWADEPAWQSVMVWTDDGSGTGMYVDLDESAEERVVSVTDQWHDWVVEELWGLAPVQLARKPSPPDESSACSPTGPRPRFVGLPP